MHSCLAGVCRMCSLVWFKKPKVLRNDQSHLTPPVFDGWDSQIGGFTQAGVKRASATRRQGWFCLRLSLNICHTFLSLCVRIVVEMCRVAQETYCDYDLGISVKTLTLTWEQTAVAYSSVVLITSVSWRNTFRLEGKGTLSLNQRSW